MRWYTRMGRRVWLHEIWNFLFRDRRLKQGPTLAEFWGAPQDADEEAMRVESKRGARSSGKRLTA
jgi:anaerobic magnesium-protoporphyrin IX monomethyl ester cyclase